MNASYKMDFASKTLTLTKAFADACGDPTSKEYAILTCFQKDFPDLKIVRKTHKTPTKYHNANGETTRCNQFKHLTYENMERFMNAIPDNEGFFKVYNSLRGDMGLVQYNRSTLVRSWFAAQFPDYREDPLFYLTNKVEVITEIAPIIAAVIAVRAKREQKNAAKKDEQDQTLNTI